MLPPSTSALRLLLRRALPLAALAALVLGSARTAEAQTCGSQLTIDHLNDSNIGVITGGEVTTSLILLNNQPETSHYATIEFASACINVIDPTDPICEPDELAIPLLSRPGDVGAVFDLEPGGGCPVADTKVRLLAPGLGQLLTFEFVDAEGLPAELVLDPGESCAITFQTQVINLPSTVGPPPDLIPFTRQLVSATGFCPDLNTGSQDFASGVVTWSNLIADLLADKSCEPGLNPRTGDFDFALTITNPFDPNGATLHQCEVSDPGTSCDGYVFPEQLPADGSSASVSCSGPSPVNRATVTCDLVENPGQFIERSAGAACDAVEVDKQVSCDSGKSWRDVGYGDGAIEGCTGWSGATAADEILFRYRARNAGGGELTGCVLTDTNQVVIADPGVQIPFALPVGFDDFIHETPVPLDCDEVRAQEPNTTTLTCTGATGVVSHTDTATVAACQEPAVTIQKDCSPERDPATGDFLYTVAVTNTGEAALDNCRVTDADASGCETVFGPLAPGAFESIGCASPSPANAAAVTCDIVGSFDPAVNGPKTIGASAAVVCGAVEVDKQVSCDSGSSWRDVGYGDDAIEGCTGWSGAAAADEILFRYRARNTGGGELTGCVLTDTNQVVIADPGVQIPFALPVGFDDFIHETPVPLDCDEVRAQEPNTTTLTCSGATGIVSHTDTATVAACQEPALELAKVCSNERDPQGNFIYTVVVANPPNPNGATLDGCVLTDSSASCEPLSSTGPLAPGASATTTCTSPSPTNTASVTCEIVGSSRPGSSCPGLSLSDERIVDAQALSACGTLEVGPNVSVIGPKGSLALTSGTSVVLNNDVQVEIGGVLVASLDPSLLSPRKTIAAQAAAACDDVQVDKQVSCDNGNSWQDVGYGDGAIDGCTGWSGPTATDEILFRYRARNRGAGDLNGCVLEDTNPVVVPNPIAVGDLAVGEERFVHETPAPLDCDEVRANGAEPNTVTLTCIGANGALADSDVATVEACLEPDLTVVKECAVVQGGSGFDYVVTATNTGGATLENCALTDALADCDPLLPTSPLAPGASATTACTSTGQTNTASVTCDITGAFLADGSPKTISSEDSAACADECPTQVAFDEFPAGEVITTQYAGIGLTVTTSDPSNHPAMVFDSFSPTGGDFALGTPNADFGGPGIGAGGGFAEPGQNSLPLGKILIRSADNNSADPKVDDGAGTIVFTFDRPMPLISVGVLDIGGDEQGGTVTAFDAEINGSVLASAPILTLGDNSYQDVPVVAEGVRRIEVSFSSSAAVTSLVFCPLFCVEDGVSDPRVNWSGTQQAVWLPGISTDFVFDPFGDFVPLGDGTASLTGTIRSWTEPGKAFLVDMQLSGRTTVPPPGSPKRELVGSAYTEEGGPIDVSTFVYYTDYIGTLTGIDDLQGAVLQFTPVGFAFQLGKGASGKNTNHGASSWFDWIVVSQPNDPSILLPNGFGDINVDLPRECFAEGCVPMTYLDDFEDGTYSGGVGTWVGPWLENDPGGTDQSPSSGHVQVEGGGLRLDNFGFPDPNNAPSAWRTADLTGKRSAWLRFDWHFSFGVDPGDIVVAEVSGDGVDFAVVARIDWTFPWWGRELVDISDHISSSTTVRFRIEQMYDDEDEFFWIDDVEITGSCLPPP